MNRTQLCICICCIFATGLNASEIVLGGPCQGCELAFVEMPEKQQHVAQISQANEDGEKLALKGTVYNQDGKPANGITIYAYHTNNQGNYPQGNTAHGALRGWARTNAAGQYRFDTIRPRAYPGRSIPEHIHLHVIEPKKGTYYIDSVEFSDDPLLIQSIINSRHCRGGCGVATPKLNNKGVWQVRRDIVLGQGIEDY